MIRDWTTVCIQCKGVAKLTEWRNNGDRTYRCKKCKGVFGSPTKYSECRKMGIIEKEVQGYNDCHHCTYFQRFHTQIMKDGKCPFLIRRNIPFAEIYHKTDYLKKHGLKIIEV